MSSALDTAAVRRSQGRQVRPRSAAQELADDGSPKSAQEVGQASVKKARKRADKATGARRASATRKRAHDLSLSWPRRPAAAAQAQARRPS